MDFVHGQENDIWFNNLVRKIESIVGVSSRLWGSMAKSDKVQKSVNGHAWTICCLILVCGLGIQTIVNN